jgi:hypothetical protein
LKGYQCKTGSDTDLLLSIDFKSVEDSELALKIWTDTKDIVFLVGNENDCAYGGQSITGLTPRTLSRNAQQIVMNVNFVPLKSVIKDYRIQVTKLDRPFRLDANYDFKTDSIKTPLINLLKNQQATLNCANCHSKGSTIFEIMFEGDGHSIRHFELSLKGELHANMDIQLKVHLIFNIKAVDGEAINQENVIKQVTFPIIL